MGQGGFSEDERDDLINKLGGTYVFHVRTRNVGFSEKYNQFSYKGVRPLFL